jgi:organic radical activating enzyme
MLLNSVEFYITNVCNLACDGCNRFNNYQFKGWQRWADYQDIYARWAQELRIRNYIGILGGEPLLNPDYLEWLDGIRGLWPNVQINTVTNAYRLNQVRGLYDRLQSDRLLRLKIGIHNKSSKQLIFSNIRKFLTGPLNYDVDHSNHYQEKIHITDANGVKILVEYNWWFHQGSLQRNPQSGEFTLYESDQDLAHKNCSMKTCHTFHRGRLYKCGVAALLPEFDQQYPITLSPERRAIMLSYPGLDIDQTTEEKYQFVQELSNPIAQCQFCPETYQGQQIAALEKKVLFRQL